MRILHLKVNICPILRWGKSFANPEWKSPAQDLCFFCALRLQAKTQSNFYSQKRFLQRSTNIYSTTSAISVEESDDYLRPRYNEIQKDRSNPHDGLARTLVKDYTNSGKEREPRPKISSKSPNLGAAAGGWIDNTLIASSETVEANQSDQILADRIATARSETPPRPSAKVVRYECSVAHTKSFMRGQLEPTDQLSQPQRPRDNPRAARKADEFMEGPVAIPAKVDSVPYRKTRRGKPMKSRSVSEYDDYDNYNSVDDDAFAQAKRRRQSKEDRALQEAASRPCRIILPDFITIANLAMALRVELDDFVKRLRILGFDETNNGHVLDAETAGLIATEFHVIPIIDKSEDEDLVPRPQVTDKSLLSPRPPVVTIMGHVDHGKTTLLDWLRKSSVAASEHGGITQHIGAFTVPMPSGKIITFLDTPGHAAFLSMRQRGAHVTDIVILVVAADDSVKPQTIEAIKHAQTAKVPIIVAISKIDKDDANVERVKQDLARHGVEVEDIGGDTQVVCISGKTGQGMEELEDAAIALADVLDMRAETNGQAEGWVLEATTKKVGKVATVLIRRGTVRRSDIIVAGSTWAKIRTLKNEAGVEVASAGPGTPVEVDGWRDQPLAGDEVLQAPDEQRAKSVVEMRRERADKRQMAADVVAVNASRRLEQGKREKDNLKQDAQVVQTNDIPALDLQAGIKEIFFIIKADVSGSAEAVLNGVSALGNEEVRPHILRTAVGPVSESDIEHAAVANGHIISFNTPVEAHISRMAETAGVSILDQSIIYRLVDDVKAKLSEHLLPITISRVVGEAEVLQVFEININGRVKSPIAGCKIRNGLVSKTCKVKVLRGKEIVYDGE